ncbi:MAG: ATP-binding protein [Chloroflexaceae bacterium]
MSLHEFAQEIQTVRDQVVQLYHRIGTALPEEHALLSGPIEDLMVRVEQVQRRVERAGGNQMPMRAPAPCAADNPAPSSDRVSSGSLADRFTQMEVMIKHKEALVARERAARISAEEARQRLSFLAEVSHILVEAPDTETMLARVARFVAAFLADWCAIDMIEPDGQIRCVTMAHRFPEGERLLHTLHGNYPGDPVLPGPVFQVIQTGQPVFMPEVVPILLEPFVRDAEHLRLLQTAGIRSAMIVPLKRHGQVLGTISFVSAGTHHYELDDLGMAKNLTSRVAAAVEQVRRYQEAQETVQQRDQFLSIFSHELKTPLTTLLGFSRILQQWVSQPRVDIDRTHRGLERIVEQVYRLNDLINVLLDFSRLQTSQFAIQRVPMDLGALIREVVEEIRPVLQHHTITVNSSGAPLIVAGDYVRLRQVVQNLLDNALKYSPNGGAVRIELEQDDDQASIRIRDQGIGIPAAALPHLFQGFYRAANVDAHRISGMGIGLYVVNEIVTMHDGTVEVLSDEGVGSTFTIYLPLMERSLLQPAAQIKERTVCA